MKNLMELKDITKRYKDKIVFEKISFPICANQIIALVGKNGSGKSTLLKIIGGLVKPDSGEVYKHAQSLKIGYVPEVTPSDIPFTPEEYLTHMGSIRGMANHERRKRIDYLLELFCLQNARKIRISNFSKGMKQKVMIMQAMLEETDLLIMDEPLSGLDPKAQSDLEDILLTLKDRGLSIVLTCHETKLLETLVGKIFLIKDHQVIQMSSLHKAVSQMNRIIFEIPTQKSLEEYLSLIDIQKKYRLRAGMNQVEATVKQENTDKILMELLKRDASIKQLIPIDRAREEFYRYF